MASIKVIDLQQEKDEKIDLDKLHIGFLFYIMKNIFSRNLYKCIERAQVMMKLLAKENRGFKFLGNALCYTMTTADDINEKEELIKLFTDCISQKDKGKFMTIADQFREEGKKEGILLGIEKGMERIVNNMLTSNMTISNISKVTKLSPSEIKRFQKHKVH